MSSIPNAASNAENRQRLADAISLVNRVVLGKADAVELAFACLLARGHLLIEDIPGVGKTTLAQALAKSIGADYHRIQFTSDLLPADILGVSVYRRDQERFEFHPGPIFSQLVLADEVNRATPKTQSALLEAMAESQVTIEGKTVALPKPFFVIATQNPLDTIGTFPLPDSQLDRFLLSLQLGYPDPAMERELLLSEDRQTMLDQLQAVLAPADIADLQQQAGGVHISEPLVAYVQALLDASRDHPDCAIGLSPRAGLALVRAAKALAMIDGRDFAIPEDIKRLFVPLARHRLQPRSAATEDAEGIARQLLDQVAIP